MDALRPNWVMNLVTYSASELLDLLRWKFQKFANFSLILIFPYTRRGDDQTFSKINRHFWGDKKLVISVEAFTCVAI
jgi:hypothetical protein